MRTDLHLRTDGDLDPRVDFYTDAFGLLNSSGIPFLVGGTFAYSRYTAIQRDTKDMDVFVRRSDCAHTLRVFEDAGYDTDLPYPHWLAKVHRGDDLLDVVFASGNGVAKVDDEWFAHAAESEVLGMLSREQYLHDLAQLGYLDSRLPPHGTMTTEEIRLWTEAIEPHWTTHAPKPSAAHRSRGNRSGR